MKKMLAIVLSAIMGVTLLAACGTDPNAGNGDQSGGGNAGEVLENIKSRGELVMYTNAAFPPFEYMGDGNQVDGVDVEIAQAIADKIGVDLKVENVAFDSIIESVKGGKADIGIAGMTITDERKKNVDFSNEYVTSVQYMVLPEDSSIKTIEDLAGLQVGVQLGTTGDIILDEEINGFEEDGKQVAGILDGSNTKLSQYSSVLEATMDMKSGRIDAVVIDKLPAESIVNSNDGLQCFELVYEDGSSTEESYGITVAKGNEEFLELINEVLAELNENGQIDQWILEHTEAYTGE